jgi:hypothetical protein
MTSGNGRAAHLAQRLRELREHQWSDVNLTQVQLARALSAEGNVAHTTISSWESHSSPKAPPKVRLKAYARFSPPGNRLSAVHISFPSINSRTKNDNG